MGRQGTVDKLPEAVRQWLKDALEERNYSGYAELETLLRERGYVISRSAIHRYGKKIEEQMAAIRDTTEMARVMIGSMPDDADNRSEVVMAMVQSGLFETMINLRRASDEDIDPQQRIKLLATAAQNIAMLSRASVNQKQHRLALQARAEAAAAAVEKIAVSGGLSADSIHQLRREILGVAQ